MAGQTLLSRLYTGLSRWGRNVLGLRPRYRGNYRGEVTYVFSAGGVDYFTFVDVYKSPYRRLMVAGFFQEEAAGGVTRDMLIEFIGGIKGALGRDFVDLGVISNLVNFLEARVKSGYETDAIYYIASALLFDSEEDVYGYSEIYNKNKIAFWKAHGVDSFFLTSLLGRLQKPSGMLAEVSKAHYLEALKRELEEGYRLIQKSCPNSLLNYMRGNMGYKKAWLLKHQ